MFLSETKDGFQIRLTSLFAMPLVVFAWSMILIPGCTSVTITPGKVIGNISYTDASPEILDYLNNTSVEDPSYDTVRMYSIDEESPIAQSQHIPDNMVYDSQTYQAAHFLINPNVKMDGTDLLLTVTSLEFANNTTYKFGSINPQSPYSRLCEDIKPLEVDPEGTECHISECPSLLDLHLAIVGAQEDLDAIQDDPAHPVSCSARLEIEDIPGSNTYSIQSLAGARSFTLQELLSGDAQILFLGRAVDSQVNINVSCKVPIAPGETGFITIPDTNLTPLNSTITLESAACGARISPPVIELPLERSSGRLIGYFDVSGFDESPENAMVCVDDSSSTYGFSSNFCTEPAVVPAGTVPTQKWEFEGIEAGWHSVWARAIIAGGDYWLKFPAKTGMNGLVYIPMGETVDLGGTFVSHPVTAHGRLKLYDRGGQTDLNQFESQAFTDFWSSNTSFMAANGDRRIANAENGASGEYGESRGRLIGNYDSEQNLALFNYQLLLNGLSPPNGDLNGQDAFPTQWDINFFHLLITPESGEVQNTSISQAASLSYIADISQFPGEETIEVPEQHICFGKTSIELNVSPQIGTLSSPELLVRSEGIHNSTSIGTTQLLSIYNTTKGAGSAGTTASVSATLPEGFQYQITPSVYFRPTGADNSTLLHLDPIFFPDAGVLGCGQDAGGCINISDLDGSYTMLRVNITNRQAGPDGATPLYCLADGNLNLDIKVNSDGVEVVRVAYVLDPSSTDGCRGSGAEVLCSSDCGQDPVEYSVDLTGIEPGEHTLVACATDVIGCQAFDKYTFNVDPRTPHISCEQEIFLHLQEEESFIPATDPRVTDTLHAEIVGNCQLPIRISDDRPNEFLAGQRPVTFTSESALPCTTNVIVEPDPNSRIISFVTLDSGVYELRSYEFLSDTQLASRIDYTDWQSFHFEYNNTGTRLAIIPNGSGLVRIFDLESDNDSDYFPVPSGYTLHDIAFDPQNPSRYAIVGTQTANTDQHAIFIYTGNVQMSRYDLPVFAASLRISQPLISWSPDGSKISISFTQPAPALNTYPICIAEYNIVDNTLTTTPILISNFGTSLQQFRELVYQDENWRALATEKMIGLGTSQSDNPTLFSNFLVKNVDIDLTPDGMSAAFVEKVDLTHGDVARVGFATPFDYDSRPNVFYDSTAYAVTVTPSVAVSSDSRFAAVGLNDKVLVFAVPEFNQVAQILATRPQNLEFKPY